MKKLFFVCSVIMGLVALVAIKSNSSKQSDITIANLLSIATAQAEGTGNTGPAQVVDCAGVGTGTKKVCLCTNTSDCTESGCS